ncbi:MAG: type II toxin-antitoxin system HicA family toxin [Verrucomicrobiae bacterium]|nr:type II toxin-antitoxin system HicA family toxin [Verrucomicrobiae bacterium]
MPRKIRQLIADLERAGFSMVPGGKGSHRKFRHPRYRGSLLLSGRDGDDARPYQESQIRTALNKVSR